MAIAQPAAPLLTLNSTRHIVGVYWVPSFRILTIVIGFVNLGGNIGRPLLPDIASVCETDVAVVELSSFQLTGMRRSPAVAVVTNVAPNHLDWHTDMDEYDYVSHGTYQI